MGILGGKNKSADTNIVRFGISNMHIAFFSDDSTPGKPMWDTPIKIPGMVGFKPEAQSEEYTFPADNITYYSIYSNGGYTGTAEAALIPDDVVAKMFGWVIDEIGGMLEVQGGRHRDFALMGQFEGDKYARRFVYYNCTAGVPSEEGSTVQKSIEVKPQTLKLTMNPLDLGNGNIATKYTLVLNPSIPNNKTAYNAFYEAVYIPPAEKDDADEETP